MDLGVPLESPQGSQSSFRMRACTCAFLQSGSSSVTHSAAWIKRSMVFPEVFPMRLSHEAFPQGCPTCTSGGSRSSASTSRQCRENWFLWNGLTHLGDSWNGGTTLEFLSPFLWRGFLLRCDGNAGNTFPKKQGKDPSSRARRRKRGSLDVCGTLVLPPEWRRVCRGTS